jgi:flagellar biosynthesis protein FlhF
MLEAVIAAASAELSASELGDQGIIDATLARLFAQRIAVRRLDLTRGGPHVVALLGSTGVGKTTTIAKLAALLRLRHGRRVALVTADTYRIAAVDQLRTYAEIIGLTFRVCMTPQDVARARADLVRSHDVVIIDTPGRGPRDAGRVGDLAELVDAAAPDERHLVVSAGGHPAAIGEVSARFAPTSPDRLLLTKLDEAHGLGMIAAASSATGLPISYLTTGQEVPDDIEPPTPERLGQLIVLSDPADMEGPA